MSKQRDLQQYLKDYPKAKKWLNECMVCHTIGYKPDMPKKIHPGELSENLRKLLPPLEVNDVSICIQCEQHFKN